MRTRESKMDHGIRNSEAGSSLSVAVRDGVRARALVCVSAVVLTACFYASAQYPINWHTMDGGGGTSTASVYSVSGTIGQPDASDTITGGNYSLTGGFWALLSVVQTPGAPTLSISHSGNTVKVYWQAVSGWTNLEQNSSLSLPANWADSSGVTNTNGTNYLSITPPSGNLFFRLKKP